jgi:SAM-dependent methyltransferase
MQVYNESFYSRQRHQSLESAKVIVPIVLELTKPRSVVDVGCGLGTWLSIFRQHGVEDVLGLDGDYIDRKQLLVNASQFRAIDLSRGFRLERQFDLAVSLEVGEHLPLESAASFVDSIAGLAPCVLFSAGLPFQGGTNHINEQWPEFWVEHFSRNRFVVIDCIRQQVWRRREVQPCYAQNSFIFVHQEQLDQLPRLKTLSGEHNLMQLSVVHPEIYLSLADPARQSFRAAARAALDVGKRAFKRRLKALWGANKSVR